MIKKIKKWDQCTSLDEKLSDLVGTSNFKLGNSLDLDYNFSLDQNYKDINFNEMVSNLNLS